MSSKSSTLFAALAIAFVALISSLIAVFFSLRADAEFSIQSETSAQIIASLEDIREAMLNAETGQRGFLLTGNPAYLESFELGLTALPKSFERLESHLDGKKTPDQTERIHKAYLLVDAKVSELKDSVGLYARGDTDAAIAQVYTHEGKILMDELREEIAALIATERSILSDAQGKARQAKRAMLFT